MIRKTRSRALAALTTATVVSLATLFACMRNAEPSPAPAAQPAAAPTPGSGDTGAAADAATSERGKAAYERLRCSSCHSLGGQGNTSSPLDGVGAKRDRAALRDWTIGSGAAKDSLPAGIVRMKAGFADDADLDALVAWLATLR